MHVNNLFSIDEFLFDIVIFVLNIEYQDGLSIYVYIKIVRHDILKESLIVYE